ncbi:MAG: heme lyase CcmF/NrfE family subunit [Actinomycetota bacterium]|nr:heme lyase CcmF/NrfE family subunit [Actinomycetota bacterium]
MDLGSAGRYILVAALGTALWSAAASGAAAFRRNPALAASGRRGLFATGALIAAGVGIMIAALYARDFSIAYVAGYSSRSTPPVYTLTALWAGMEGSMLFWTFVTCVWAVSAIALLRVRETDLWAVATSVLSGVIAFFVGLLVFGANPFAPSSPIPPDGNGLNPLLQSPFMAIHPVLLYLGFTGFAVPFAFAVSALVAGRLEVGWFTSTRRWTVLAWAFLTAGIALGAAWAYMELGWGGFWAWDPVENASLLPWLTGTAFLHSVLVQERRGMLKIWNVALILATYCLAIFGTFLTRSGLLSSVHTFSESPVGKLFLPLLAVMLLVSFGLLGWRYEKLRSGRRLESMFCREAMFLFNNLLLVAIAFTVLWGTIYPVLVEAFSQAKISVGPPFFNTVIVPMGIALLALAGVGPLVTWRRGSWPALKRQLVLPLSVGAGAVLALASLNVRSAGAMFGVGVSAFVAAATVGEFVRGARGHRTPGRLGWLKGLVEVVARNRRRYGGYIVHLGVVLICLGLSGTPFKQSWSGTVAPGERFEIGRYSVAYDSRRVFATDEKLVRMAVMNVEDENGRRVARLTPQRNLHMASNQPQSEIGLKTSLVDDLYVVLTEMDSSGRVSVRAWINPLVAWIWIGAGVMIAGTLIVLSSARVPTGASRAARARFEDRVAVPA